MTAPWFEVLVAGAERQFAEAGKVSNLSFWAFKILIRARRPEYLTPPLFPRTQSTGNPENFKVGDGYVDYCAWRRYTDLEWFRTHLAEEFPGCVIPPIPEKDSGATNDKVSDLIKSGRKDNSQARETAANNPLVAQRIRRFQLFFNELLKLTELYSSEHLRAFVAMEEAEWIQYKQAVEAKKSAGGGWEKVKGSAFSIFSAIKNAASTKVHVFDEISGLGKIRKQQLEMSDALMVSQRQISNMTKVAHQAKQKDPHQLDGLAACHAGKPLPHTLVYNGHQVSVNGNSGVVRHVDDKGMAWVDTGAQKLLQIPINELQYPNTGIADPAITSVNHHLTQMESYFAYVGKTQLSQDILKLQDSLWFEGAYCHAVVDTVNNLEEVERKRLSIQSKIGSEKDASKRSAMEAEVQDLQTKFAQQCTKISQDYDRTFRPRQTAALASILPSIGPLLAGLLSDNDWENRLAPADASLPLLFDIPDEVVQAEKKAKDAADAQKEPAPMMGMGYGGQLAGQVASTTAAAVSSAAPVYGRSQSPEMSPPQPESSASGRKANYQDPFATDPAPPPYQPKAAAPVPSDNYASANTVSHPLGGASTAPQPAPVYTPAAASAPVPAAVQSSSAMDDAGPPAPPSPSAEESTPPPMPPAYTAAPVVHDEEPPPPPTEEEEPTPVTSNNVVAAPEPTPEVDSSTISEQPADGRPRAATLMGPQRTHQPEEDAPWDGDGPPPMPESPHDV